MVKNVRFCDKCNEEIKPTFGYKEYRIETLHLNNGNYDMRKYELCTECFYEIQKLIDPELFDIKVREGYYSIEEQYDKKD